MVELEELVFSISQGSGKKKGYLDSDSLPRLELSSQYSQEVPTESLLQIKNGSLYKKINDSYTSLLDASSYSTKINKFKVSENYISKNYSNINETKINKYSDLESIISNTQYNKEFNIIDKILSKDLNPEYSSIIQDFSDLGYREKSSHRTREGTAISTDTPASVVEVATESVALPDEYRPLLLKLSKQHPGLVFTGSTIMANASQHEVELLTFSYVEHGRTHELTVVAKDKLPSEELVARGLKGIGVHTYSVLSATDRQMLMEHLGRQTVGDVITYGSHTDALKAMDQALGSLAELHVLATTHLPELAHDFGVKVPSIDYVSQFVERFLLPVGGPVLSPEGSRLLDAYKSFVSFENDYFVHGDAHKGNFLLSGSRAGVIDFEWVGLGDQLMDLARFTNDIVRSRSDISPDEVAHQMLANYRHHHDGQAEQYGATLLPRSVHVSHAFDLALINDGLYKIGEYVLFGQLHPETRDEKMLKGVGTLQRTLTLLEGAIPYHGAVAGNLRDTLVAFVKQSPITDLREVVSAGEKPALVLPYAA